MSCDLDVQLGLCCLNTELRVKKPPIFASRSIILKTFTRKRSPTKIISKK